MYPKTWAESSKAINKQELDSLRTKKNELIGFRYLQNKQYFVLGEQVFDFQLSRFYLK